MPDPYKHSFRDLGEGYVVYGAIASEVFMCSDCLRCFDFDIDNPAW